MKPRTALLALMFAVVVAIASAPQLYGQKADSDDHSAHHPATPAAATAAPANPTGMGTMMSSAKLDELVKKMNAATGPAKTDAMAELLTALVQDRQACEPMMTKMMKMMDMMGGANGTMPMAPAK